MSATFLHTADIHLGLKLKGRGLSLSECEKRRLEIWETFENIINLARNNDLSYMFISGDLIDEKYSNFKDIKKLISLFKKVRKTKVIIVCGETDPYSITSLYDYMRWPDNVYICRNTKTVEKYEFEDDNICIYAISNGEGRDRDFLGKLDSIKTDGNKINILVAHGLFQNMELMKSKFDYCALGGIHTFDKYDKKIIYPGTPEPFDYDIFENSEHGIVLGEIVGDNLQTRFTSICKRKMINKKVEIKKDFDFNKILDCIRQSGNDINSMRDYIRIVLSGSVGNGVSITEVKRAAKEFFYSIDFIDSYTYEKSITELAGKIKGNIIENYITQFEKDDTQDELYEKAFELGLNLLKNEGGMK